MARSSTQLVAAALACAVSATVLAGQPAQRQRTPAEWLARMDQALTTRNYIGTFLHSHGEQAEMLRIIHRVQDGVVSERLVSLDGSGREFIRTAATLSCYLPDKRTVLVEQHPREESLVRFPTVTDETAKFYDISEVRRARLNGRDTHMIIVAPKDKYRYGYRLWVDDATAMPLKTELCDAHGQAIERIVFASLTLPSRIPDSDFRPEVSTAGFQWLGNQPAARPLPPVGGTLAWNAMRLPPGFRMAVRSAQLLPGSSHPVDHVVFTDGFASVSVFVEPQPQGARPPLPESATVGSSSAFSMVVGGVKVTAVGEVPPETVQFIVSQVGAPAPTARGPAGH